MAAGNPGEMDPAKLGVTTAMEVNAPWMAQLGVNPQPTNLDALGEVIFRDLSDAQQDEAIAQQAPIGIYFTDLKKSPGYGDPKTYWSINLEDATLPRYYRLLKKMREVAPGRDSLGLLPGDRLDQGLQLARRRQPGSPGPELHEAAQRAGGVRDLSGVPQISTMDGQNVSLRDVIDIFTIDAYPGRGFGPFDGSPDKSDRSWTSYQLYSMIYDTMVARKVVPASAKIVWFGWSSGRRRADAAVYQAADGARLVPGPPSAARGVGRDGRDARVHRRRRILAHWNRTGGSR